MESLRVEIFKINSEISDNLFKILKYHSDKPVSSHDATVALSRVIEIFNSEKPDKMYNAVYLVNEYIKNEIRKGNIEDLTIQKIIDRSVEINDLVYNEKYNNYKVANDYIKNSLDYLKSLNRSELLTIEKNSTNYISQKLGFLFGANKGQIISEFNIGMYDMNQHHLHEYFKANNVVYKNDRFTDIMNDELLIYKLAGLSLLKDDVDCYYQDLYDISLEEKEKIKLQGFFDSSSDEYKEIKKYAKVIGSVVKELYNKDYNITPFKQLIMNGTQEQLMFLEEEKSKHLK